jgi:hypothetical protein
MNDMAESYFSRTIYPRESTSIGDDTFAFDFDYTKPDDVKVSIDGNDYLYFTLLDASTVKLDTPLTEAVDLAVYRSTFLNNRAVDFVNAAELSESDLDDSANQVFFAMQEAYDLARDSIKPSPDGSFSLGGRPLKDVGIPLEDDWAATKGYVDGKTPRLESIRDETAGIRDETAVIRDNTDSIRNSTNSLRLQTLGYRDTTLGYRNDTLSFRNTAEQHRDDTLSFKQAADGSKVDAAGYAATASTILVALQGDQVQYTSAAISASVQAQGSGSYHLNDGVTLTLPDAGALLEGATLRVTTDIGSKPSVKVPDASSLDIETTKGNDTEVILDGNVEFIFIFKTTHWEV